MPTENEIKKRAEGLRAECDKNKCFGNLDYQRHVWTMRKLAELELKIEQMQNK